MKKTRRFILALMLAFGVASCSSTPRRNETINEGAPDNQGIPNVAPEGRITEAAARNEADSSLPVMTADSPPIVLTPVQGDATPPPAQTVPASEDWQTFTSTALGVAVDYPLDWSVAEEIEGAIFTSPQGTTITLQTANAVHDNNETRMGNQRCTSRTNPYGLTADICVGNSSFIYIATFILQVGDGAARGVTLMTRTRTVGDVFEGMFNSVRLVK
jgi:hypothetical protein